MMKGRRQGSGIGVLAMAGAVPSHVRTNEFWGAEFRAQYAKRSRTDLTTAVTAPESVEGLDPEVMRAAGPTRTDIFKGTKKRRVLDPELHASDLEVAAGRAAMAAAGVDPSAVDQFFLYSLLPDDVIPLTHAKVASKLGLRPDVIAFSLAASCGSFPVQFHTAAQLSRDTTKTTLIIQSAIMSRLQDYSLPNSVNGGDGAVATVLGPVSTDRGYVAYKQYTKGQLSAGVRAISKSAPHAPWYATDKHETPIVALTDDVDAARVMGGRAASFCRETCSALLEESGYTPDDVDWFVVSQPTIWFGQACCDAMGVSTEKTLNTFEEYAHMMAASAPMNLMTAARRRKLEDGDLVMIYSPGAGFVQNALLMRWQGCPTKLVEVGST